MVQKYVFVKKTHMHVDSTEKQQARGKTFTDIGHPEYE